MTELLLKIKSDKSADTIKSLLEEIGIDAELIGYPDDKAWMPGKPFTKDEMEERHQKSRDQIAVGNVNSLNEVKESVKELFKKHGHDLHP
ncbi:hypothetical protein BH10BAC3_BH10BAC3_31810 [soil metagenome]